VIDWVILRVEIVYGNIVELVHRHGEYPQHVMVKVSTWEFPIHVFFFISDIILASKRYQPSFVNYLCICHPLNDPT
jgi:hypothetical protein